MIHIRTKVRSIVCVQPIHQEGHHEQYLLVLRNIYWIKVSQIIFNFVSIIKSLVPRLLCTDDYKLASGYFWVQCFFFSRNTAQVTPKIIYFYYLKIYFQDQSIQKINKLILKKETLFGFPLYWELWGRLLFVRLRNRASINRILHIVCVFQGRRTTSDVPELIYITMKYAQGQYCMRYKRISCVSMCSRLTVYEVQAHFMRQHVLKVGIVQGTSAFRALACAQG